MATSKQIRERIVQLIRDKEFTQDELMKVFEHMIHEGILDTKNIIGLFEYLGNDILRCKTKMSYSRQINPRTGKKYSYNAHQFQRIRAKIDTVDFIVCE